MKVSSGESRVSILGLTDPVLPPVYGIPKQA